MGKIFEFDELDNADLIIDAIYKGGSKGNIGDEPISKLMGTNNQGGFRYLGNIEGGLRLCVLFSSLEDLDWPDHLDTYSGLFTYYGDNKEPGRELHDTNKKGNEVLKVVYNHLHFNEIDKIPPFFIFTKTGHGRDVVFRGLAVPGGESINQTEDLVAIWKTKRGERFQNYKAIFTILDCPIVNRDWLIDLQQNNNPLEKAPTVWKIWVRKKTLTPLIAPRSITHRSKGEQIPIGKLEKDLVQEIIHFFKNHPEREYAFEKCAGEIVLLSDSNIYQLDLTRPWRDGGRDGIGQYKIGLSESSISVEFALEAKCKVFSSGVGVKETSRLISRLRHRQFGILVTTSYVSEQAYKEIIEDQHPVIIFSAIDIANILINVGINNLDILSSWLERNFS